MVFSLRQRQPHFIAFIAHEGIKGTVVFDCSTSPAFDIRSGVKQGCVVTPTLFGIFFAVLLKHAFGSTTEDIYLRTRSDGKLFNLSRLRVKSKVQVYVTLSSWTMQQSPLIQLQTSSSS